MRALQKSLVIAAVVLGPSCASVEQQQPPQRLAVVFEPVQDTALAVTVTASGLNGGTTVFTAGTGFGDTRTELDWFTQLRVSCQPGCLSVDRSGAGFVEISHDPGATVSVSYVLHGSDAPADVDDYRPHVGEHGIHLFSPLSLLLPDEALKANNIRLRIEWLGEGPLFTSLGPAAPDVEGVLPGRDLHNLQFSSAMNGPSSSSEYEIFAVVVLDVDLIDPAVFSNRIIPIVEQTKALFPELESSWYFVSIQSAGEEIENGFSIGGTAARSAFAIYANPGLDLEKYGHVFDGLLAHEYFHNWNGVLFFVSGEEEHGARWFVEGFTDFYARRIAYRAKAWSRDEAISHLNEQIDYFEKSDVRDASLSDLISLWEEQDPRSLLSYKRGDLIALAVDEEVRCRSNGAKSLDDLMRFLATEAASGRMPSVDDVFDWIERHTSSEFAQKIRHVVIRGGQPPLPPVATELKAVLDDALSRYVLDTDETRLKCSASATDMLTPSSR